MPEYKAILFDLDGTLLDSSMEHFLPVYLKALSGRVALFFEREAVCHPAAVGYGTDGGERRATNQEVFMDGSSRSKAGSGRS